MGDKTTTHHPENFPSLDIKDYLGIGRMCMAEEMPRNSESTIAQIFDMIDLGHSEH